MDPTRTDLYYCADFPQVSLPAPLAVRTRLAITELAQMLAFARRAEETLRDRILRVQLIAERYPPDSA